MQQKNAIVLVIDRLGAGFLGPYGNTWVETPHFNQLASQSCLFEFAITDTPCLDGVHRSFWQGMHAMSGESSSPAALRQFLSDAGIRSTLITDDQSVAEHPLSAGFDEQILHPATTPPTAADEFEQTQLAQFFAAAIETLAQPNRGLTWIHTASLGSAWDAPLALRQQFADEDDPPPPDLVVPPSMLLTPDHDPDELLGLTQAYAGQVFLLDMCLGALLDAVDQRDDETLLIVTSPRGFPLGEHGCVGDAGELLHEELLHVPLMIRLPGRVGAMTRSQALAQPADVQATLVDWFASQHDPAGFGRSLLPVVRNESKAVRDFVCSATTDQKALRTPAWFLHSSQEQHRLFVKPDDRWEVNDVADRCEDIVEQLHKALDDFEQASANGRYDELPPLDSHLTSAH